MGWWQWKWSHLHHCIFERFRFYIFPRRNICILTFRPRGSCVKDHRRRWDKEPQAGPGVRWWPTEMLGDPHHLRHGLIFLMYILIIFLDFCRITFLILIVFSGGAADDVSLLLPVETTVWRTTPTGRWSLRSWGCLQRSPGPSTCPVTSSASTPSLVRE